MSSHDTASHDNASHVDHGHFDAESGPWPMGWAFALVAGLGAALLAVLIGGAGVFAGGAIGLVSFAVFGALLGAGGVERTAPAGHDHHGDHGGHSHAGGHA